MITIIRTITLRNLRLTWLIWRCVGDMCICVVLNSDWVSALLVMQCHVVNFPTLGFYKIAIPCVQLILAAYTGRCFSGIIYMFTLGLFGIGWLFDMCNIPNMVDEVSALLVREASFQMLWTLLSYWYGLSTQRYQLCAIYCNQHHLWSCYRSAAHYFSNCTVVDTSMLYS